MTLGLRGFREEAGRLDYDVNAQFFPGESRGTLLYGEALDLVAIDYEGVVFLCARG
jgi:hypothetical protein